jgi:hypothetical protein
VIYKESTENLLPVLPQLMPVSSQILPSFTYLRNRTLITVGGATPGFEGPLEIVTTSRLVNPHTFREALPRGIIAMFRDLNRSTMSYPGFFDESLYTCLESCNHEEEEAFLTTRHMLLCVANFSIAAHKRKILSVGEEHVPARCRGPLLTLPEDLSKEDWVRAVNSIRWTGGRASENI